MKIILKYVPKNTTYQQIFHFLKPTLAGGLFIKLGEIKGVLVFVHKHGFSQAVDFHVILDIQPDEVAKRVVKKLHRKKLNGQHKCVAISLRVFGSASFACKSGKA